MKIKNIIDLRDHAIDTIEKLRNKKIKIDEAGVTGKLYEGIISSLKVELEYHKMIQSEPNIPFLGVYNKPREKALPAPKRGRLIEYKK